MSCVVVGACRRLAILSCLALVPFVSGTARADQKPPAPRRPQVEVVFCLDTTGSMGGLIEGAKQKIWAISNQIAGGKPVPELKIGLVAYRDRGDAYITKVVDLTDDLDAIHAQLRQFQAAGGGDEPESVNQALHDAVHKIKWSTAKDTLRLIFLVGDAPPHLDYPDDVKYPVTCKTAAERGIIINTVQCGGSSETRRCWQDICKRAEGSYVQIAQDGGVVAIATPYDRRLAEINSEMTRTILVYGDARAQARGAMAAGGALGLAPESAADRAAFGAKVGRIAAYDLLDGIRDGKVELEKLPAAQLPPELQKLSPAQRRARLDKLNAQREELRKEALKLDRQRSEFIAEKLKKDSGKGKDGFDNQVLGILREQAKKHRIDY